MRVLPVLIVVALAVAACGEREAAQTSEPAGGPLAVRIVAAEATDIANRFEAGGLVAARTSANVSSRLLASVRDVRVRAGDRVRGGQVLVALDDSTLEAGSRQASAGVRAAEQALEAARGDEAAARAELVLAEAWNNRMATLRQQNSSTLQEVDEAVARLASASARAGVARARVDQAGAALEAARAAGEVASTTAAFAVVTAPFDGVVTETMVDPGDMAVPGVPLLRLDRAGGFEAHVRVDEARALSVNVGDRVSLTLQSSSAPVEAPVVEISRAVDVDPRTFLIKLALPGQAALRAGTFVRARFQGTVRSAVTVPSTAVTRQGQVATVFVVEDGVARLRLVRPGVVDGPRVEIVAGLEAGERVVAAPPPALRDGRAVSAGQEERP